MKDIPALLIKNKHGEEIMRIEYDGRVFLKGKKVETDREIVQAFAYCVAEMSGLTPAALINEIRRTNHHASPAAMLSVSEGGNVGI